MQYENTSKSCNWVEKHFSECRDGMLSLEERKAIHEHLMKCNSCTLELDNLCVTLRMLASYDEETLPAGIQTFRLPRSTFVEVFPTIQEEEPVFTPSLLVPLFSAMVLFFMVVSTW